VAEGAKDPLVDDGPGPLLIAMLGFADEDALDRAIAHAAFAEYLQQLPDGVRAGGEAMECRHYPVGGAAAPAALRAPFSYVVRYHRPAEDEAAFIANYVATHPPTLARLPAIRNIMCYFPLDRPNPPGLAKAGYMLGNEVVFDDVAAFNRAMASPVRQELRAHYHAFPPFSGANTHYPMLRRRVAGREA
jgi:diadenosine tetraphosphatase ApaH/serine/threonine PP2A family protein phosphatase